jgi:hypothetical protein
LDLEWTRYQNTHKRQRLFDWRTEVMFRRYEAGDSSDPGHETLTDYGAFTQVIWQHGDNQATGLRAEFADSNKDSGSDPLRGNRKRFSVNHTYSVSPSVKLRLQYNHDRADYLPSDSANSVWMQLVYQAGGHDEH